MIITWALLAAACLVAELLTGTLYLLVVSIAFSIACALAALDMATYIQFCVASLAAILGLTPLILKRRRSRNAAANSSPSPEISNPVATIVDICGPQYRIRWRGTEWNATGPQGLKENTAVIITGQTGNTLHIEPR